jgi:hypothetical protein
MRKQVRKCVLGISLVAVLSMTVPTMAAARDDGVGAFREAFSRIRFVVARILDIVEIKATLPPG